MSSRIYRFLCSNVLTVFYSFLALLFFALAYLKNPFKSPWAQKPRLKPPSRLTDLKYGVHKYIKVNNIKLHYVESGDRSKPLMLFLHGFPELWYSWRHQIVEFNKDYWCIAIDMRGYGDSEKPEGVENYKMELLVEDVRDLVRQLGVQKFILVAHDWGGPISVRFRDEYPDLLSACILVGSSSRESWSQQIWENSMQHLKSWYVFLFRVPYLPEMLLLMYDMMVYDKSMLAQSKGGIDQQDIECYKYWFGKTSAFRAPLNYYRANFTTCNLPKKFRSDNVPMLVSIGQKDTFLSPTLLDVMKKEYSNIETTVVENAGHCLQQEEPAKVNKLIKDFLTKNNL